MSEEAVSSNRFANSGFNNIKIFDGFAHYPDHGGWLLNRSAVDATVNRQYHCSRRTQMRPMS
jgi:hypothetical protein